MNSRTHAGFTLVEVMVVVGIIVVLAAMVLVTVNSGGAQGRDAERLSDIRNVEAALERYRLQNGRYPEGCNDTFDWSGELGTDFECQDGSAQYIRGLAPEFIPFLPADPNRDGTNSGYVYTVDNNGEVFKFMALNTVESETVTLQSEFYRCVEDWNTSSTQCAAVANSPSATGGSTPSVCSDEAEYSNDYAVSRGFSSGDSVFPFGYSNSERAREYYTDIIRCK